MTFFTKSYRRVRAGQKSVACPSRLTGAAVLNRKVSLFQNAYAKTELRRVTVGSILRRIGGDEWKRPIENLRKISKENERAFHAAKVQLPAFTLSGTCERIKGGSRILRHSGLVQGDFDDVSDVESVREKLKGDPHIAFGFVSPSGHGFKIGIAIDGERHAESFLAAQKYFQDKYGLAIDPNVKDPTRLCFVSHDPKLWVNENAIPLPLPDSDENKTPIKSAAIAEIESDTAPAESLPLNDEILNLADRFLPVEPHANHDRLFDLARAVRRVENAAGLLLKKTDLCTVLFRWHHKAKPAFLRMGQSRDEYLLEFLAAYKSVKYPETETLDRAWKFSETAELPPEADAITSPEMRRLVAFCQEMQRLCGDEDFFIPVRTVRDLFGHKNHKRAYKWFTGLCHLGILKCTVRGNQKKANHYRYQLPIPPAREIL